MEKKAHRGGKKNRKFGRNKQYCAQYCAEGRRERNKLRRLIRHVKHHPNDGVALTRIKNLKH